MQNNPMCLKLCTWNTRGFSASIPYLRKLCKENDLVCITEHWLHQNRLNKLDEVAQGINHFGRSSKYALGDNFGYHKGQGGVAILWNSNLTSITPLFQIQHDRICAVRLQCENACVINVLCVYLPARGCADDLDETLDELSAILENLELGSYNILCGDFNADLGSLGGVRSRKKADRRGISLSNFLLRYNLYSVNLDQISTGLLNTHHGPTGDTCIDYMMIPNLLKNKVVSCHTSDYDALNTSDHTSISMKITLDGIPRGAVDGANLSKLRWDKMTPEALYNRYRVPLNISLGMTLGRLINVVPGAEDIDSLMQELLDNIREHELVIPKSRFRRHIKSYWCPELNELKRVKVHAFRNWVNAGRPREATNALFMANKQAKKVFRKRLKQIAKEYDEDKVNKAVQSAELDNKVFWKMLKRERDGPCAKTPSIKDPTGKVVHNVEDILQVWKNHFASLGTPATSPNFDQNHYDMVNEKINELVATRDTDDFTMNNFTYEEVAKGISTLNSGKAPGYDGMTKEHLKYAGPNMVKVLVLLFNWILLTEYIPINFRRGVQIPLYKGKNTSTMEVNNYRGITLLTIFNKLFEVVMWKRIEGWWEATGAISNLQGACRKGVSCVHSAFVLQESIATLLETYSKIFVTYLDVSKAFDGVWIGGLFYRLWEIGIYGKTWRILFNSYKDFKCQARVQNQTSEWYPLRCGIHQGGYLSLVKYLAFINSLLTNLAQSNLCCSIYGVSVSPIGYADDIATASTSKAKTDNVLRIVYDHSCKWRYSFNPKKSAVLVFGERERVNKINASHRTYRLGSGVIKEMQSYDHLGLKNNSIGQNKDRILEKISKGRKALNAASGLGLKPGGLSIKACSMIFWALVVPIVTFASELWVLCDEDIKMLEDFQAYAGRRIQRFRHSSPRATSYVGLGWIRLEIFIYVKKMLFIRTIAVMYDDSIYKRIFTSRYLEYDPNSLRCMENRLGSPTFDMLRIANIFGLHNEVGNMLNGTAFYTKKQWKSLVWDKAWTLENQDWHFRTNLFNSTKYISATIDSVRLLIWWQIGGLSHELMVCCETMCKLVCRASDLKVDCHQFKNNPLNRPYCDKCDDIALENVEHLLMHCTFHNRRRDAMFREIEDLERYYEARILNPFENNLYTLLGKVPEDANPEMMFHFCRIVATNVHCMYLAVTKNREGVG